MDEVKIYTPRWDSSGARNYNTGDVVKCRGMTLICKGSNITEGNKRMSQIQEVFEEHEKRVRDMVFRHPWVNIVYNWIIVALVIALFVSFAIWGFDISTNRKAAQFAATAMADYQAEQQAIEDARKTELAQLAASEATIMKNEANYLAKMLYGARNFEEKYGYSTDDYMTLARCVFNRVDNPKFPNSVQEVVQQEKQWVGYSDDNPIVDKFYKIAYNAVEEWHHEVIKPVTSDYAWAELTSRGCYLKNDYEAGAYSVRWRYSS